ncbi:hypothetical protein PVAP13_9KG128185 [Panicum virgatum]|uniref:Uncharacterized protein n=1 Tax=Panicum virgatum TaxID=38727 RepID=A0A8T0NLT2_PANVG|nr:hypothetical protein PVAP13_9KG128185 [Panicum virgatum]
MAAGASGSSLPAELPPRCLQSPVHRRRSTPHPPGVRPLASFNLRAGRPPPVDHRRPGAVAGGWPDRRVLVLAPPRRPPRVLPGRPGRPPLLLRRAPRLARPDGLRAIPHSACSLGAHLESRDLSALFARRRSDLPLRRPARLGGLDGGREPEDPVLQRSAQALLLASWGRRLVPTARPRVLQDRQRGVPPWQSLPHRRGVAAPYLRPRRSLHPAARPEHTLPPFGGEGVVVPGHALAARRALRRRVPARPGVRRAPAGARRGAQVGGGGGASRGDRSEGEGPRRALALRGARRRVRALGEGVPGRPEELRLLRGARQLLERAVLGDHLRPGVRIFGTNPLPR